MGHPDDRAPAHLPRAPGGSRRPPTGCSSARSVAAAGRSSSSGISFLERDGNFLLVRADADVADAIVGIAGLLSALGCLGTAAVIAVRFKRASPPHRRAMAPERGRDRRPARLRRRADAGHPAAAAMARGLLAPARPGRVPGRPAALAAGAWRGRGPVRRDPHAAGTAAAGTVGAGGGRSEPRDRLRRRSLRRRGPVAPPRLDGGRDHLRLRARRGPRPGRGRSSRPPRSRSSTSSCTPSRRPRAGG